MSKEVIAALIGAAGTITAALSGRWYGMGRDGQFARGKTEWRRSE